MMIQKIFSFDEYEGFVNELAKHPQYSDPHFTYNTQFYIIPDHLYCLYTAFKYLYLVEGGSDVSLSERENKRKTAGRREKRYIPQYKSHADA